MKKILTANQMKDLDRYTIEEIGIPSMVLMERAALAVFDEIKSYIVDTNLKPSKTKVLIVCGGGNNGADGMAVARLLYNYGALVQVILLGDEEKYSEECKKQLYILQNMGMSVGAQIKDAEYDIIVDAMFGIGLKRSLQDQYYECVESMNRMPGFKVAVDIPSGLDTDTGIVKGIAFKADMTVTFEFLKRGLFLGDGPLYSGKVVCREIGIMHVDLDATHKYLYAFDEQIPQLLPYRNPNGNKGTFGKVYIYAGSKDTMGAALLCAKSAFSAGAGMVKVLCAKEYDKLFLERIPEVMLSCYEHDVDSDVLEQQIQKDLHWADSVVVGPGIGIDKLALDILHLILKYAKVPMVFDADALNILATNVGLKQDLLATSKEFARDLILTPHVGELGRLLSLSTTEIKEKAYECATMLSALYHCIAVCKDAKTVVAKEGQIGYLNLSGNHGMATAGSGDVLAGIIGAYAALEGDLYRNVLKAVYLHGCAGDYAAEMVGERALMASHIIEGVQQIQKGNKNA
ncbi:MAG: NAD(P)H-hydrate dehydratase [Lachnospiraceae bacterium]|nr:NAD(P)H-hydrate dehydratase [Lachnospiraceae bacterium]MBQ7360847.1 NAD(P)H-hydrate dehydratase [Lachnospiraceae bacterium]